MSSQDPRQYLNDDEEAYRLAQDGHQARIFTAMPAVVESVNLSNMTCDCQITIQGIAEDDSGVQSYTNLPLLLDVPIVFPSGGGFTMTFPIAAGDEVLVVFANRCIDAWWQNGGVNNKPMELRMHDLSDGFAIPGPRSQPRKIPSISSANLEIKKNDGTLLFSIAPGGDVTIPGNLIVQKGVQVTEDVVAQGNVQAVTGDVTAGPDDISLITHIHSGVTPGSGDSGPPVP